MAWSYRLPVASAILIFCTYGASAQSAEKSGSARPQTEQSASAPYTFTIINASGNTWGYEIKKNGKPYIRQTTVAGASGTKGYPTPEAASAAAEAQITQLSATTPRTPAGVKRHQG